MKLVLAAAFAFVVSALVFGQAKPEKTRAVVADRDQLGMTCAQILEMSSSDWITRFNEKTKDDDSGKPKTLRGIAVYGKCYDARTDRLAASLRKRGAGSLMGARGDFRDFEQALQDFTAKALAANETLADPLKSAYAQLYAKQFRYEFYQSDENKAVKPPESAANRSRMAVSPKAVAPASAPSSAAATPTASDASDPVTMAKNHFGELLDALPEDKEHPLHSAFGDIVGRSQMSETTRLEIYRYAIFVIEPLSATPFSSPPF
jgi:hypothetical protein